MLLNLWVIERFTRRIPKGQPPLTTEPVFLARSVVAGRKTPLLFPLIIIRGNAVLVWNSAHDKAVDYLDYGTGEMPRVQFGESDPHNLWQIRQAAS
jgi:hypothetical protein